jgi:phosphatidylserine decarboxylase
VISSPLSWHRHPALLKSYGALPHHLINRGLARLTSARRPAWAVQAAIRAWSNLAHISLDDFESRRFESVDDFFLRRLRGGARPLHEGVVSPADGVLVDAGSLDRGRTLWVKGQALSTARIVNAGLHDFDLEPYTGGSYAVVFLTPRGYHRIHMPCDGVLRDVRWIPGRFFPQNETALQHIPRVYERNERAVLRIGLADGRELLLVMVGASLIGGIHLRAAPREQWLGRGAHTLERRYSKGDEIGHFAFGSTVVLLLPKGLARLTHSGPDVRMGETLFRTDSGASGS